ncbi:MAG: DUF2398 family protein [Victivallaceae bacterium]|nr:DUF2398 family protein [Victivallaceae bacterium]
MPENSIETLKERYPEQVTAVLNILLESPYFYRADSEDDFRFLRRYQPEFRDFFRHWFGWELIMDSKCARVYKDRWVNQAIKPARRLQFRLGKRDECIAFMLLIEFFEKLLENNSMTVEDNHNPQFKFGDLLEYQQRRFVELFEQEQEKYSAEYIQKNILQPLMPKLIEYRFLEELKRPKGLQLTREQFIYEALPALSHYNTGRLSNSIGQTIAVDVTADVTLTPADDEQEDEHEA